MSESLKKLKVFHEAVETLRVQHGIPRVCISSSILEKHDPVEKSIVVCDTAVLGTDQEGELFSLIRGALRLQRAVVKDLEKQVERLETAMVDQNA